MPSKVLNIRSKKPVMAKGQSTFIGEILLIWLLQPNKEGLEAIMELTQDFPDAKKVAISGGDPLYLHVAMQIGVLAAFSKPIRWPEFLGKVRVILTTTQPEDPAIRRDRDQTQQNRCENGSKSTSHHLHSKLASRSPTGKVRSNQQYTSSRHYGIGLREARHISRLSLEVLLQRLDSRPPVQCLFHLACLSPLEEISKFLFGRATLRSYFPN
jgi:YesN/AraC family two-component response regulator